MGKGAKIKLVEKDNDSLFRECPVETYPGLAIQSVTDSSRSLIADEFQSDYSKQFVDTLSSK